jgi:hypothetical protein
MKPTLLSIPIYIMTILLVNRCGRISAFVASSIRRIPVTVQTRQTHASPSPPTSTSRDAVATFTTQENVTPSSSLNRTSPTVLGSFPHGPTISNKDTVFDDIDRALGVSKGPDIEVILTEHMVDCNSRISEFLHLNLLRFGHIAIRYQTSDGKQHVMNISEYFVVVLLYCISQQEHRHLFVLASIHLHNCFCWLTDSGRLYQTRFYTHQLFQAVRVLLWHKPCNRPTGWCV